MRFSVIFYENIARHRPVEDFLEEIKLQEKKFYIKLVSAINKLENQHYHRRPLTAPLGDDLFELRVRYKKLRARIIFCYDQGKVILLLHGLIKKRSIIAQKDREIAINRKQDYFERKNAKK